MAKTTPQLTPHPIADCFPMMDAQEFTDLLADVKTRGIIDPIVTYEGKILDGRNRYKAAISTGSHAPTEEYEGDDPVGYVVAKNLRRRNLTAAQRAMVAEKLANLGRGEKKSNASIEAFDESVTQEEAARKMGTSRASVQRARKVRENATPEVVAAVESGEMSLHAAEQTIDAPEVVGRVTLDLLAQAKADASELRKLASQVSAIKKRLVELAGTPIGVFLHKQRIEEFAGNLYRQIDGATPYALCPYHDTGLGEGCTACNGAGWVNRVKYSQAPEELKKAG